MKNLYRYDETDGYTASMKARFGLSGFTLPEPGRHYWLKPDDAWVLNRPGFKLIPWLEYDESKTIAENVDNFRTWRSTEARSPCWNDALQLAEGFFEGLIDAAREADYPERLPNPATLTEEDARVLLIALKDWDEGRERVGQEAAAKTVAGKPLGMSVDEVAERLERLRQRGEPFTSQRKMAEAIGTSLSNVHNAIQKTKSLHGWAYRQATPRAQTANELVTDSTAQSREPDPADEAMISEFREKADPETRTWFDALSRENQLAVLDDRDGHQRVLGRKP